MICSVVYDFIGRVTPNEIESFPIALKKQLKIPVTLNSENFSNSSDFDPDLE